MRTFDDIVSEAFLARKAGVLTLEHYLELENEGKQVLRQQLQQQQAPKELFDELILSLQNNDPRVWAEAGKPIAPMSPQARSA